jgi:hypothetical protein
MIKVHLTSIAFTGYIEYIFDDESLLLQKMNTEAELSEKQQVWFLKNMPREYQELEKLKSANVTLTEIKSDPVTFQQFWDRYDDKICSSKFKTEKAWDKLSPVDQGRAYRYISRYFNNMPAGTRKKYATTYLSDRLWNN